MGALRYGMADHEFLPLGVRLRCPRCTTAIDGLDCLMCGFTLTVNGGILNALLPERAVHYAQFIEDYERIRQAEGRGSNSKDFYLELPYKDLSGKNSAQWHIRARSYDYLVRSLLRPAAQHKDERILDLGAGNCWMSFRLALEGFRPLAVDLLTNNHDGLGAARHYRTSLRELFPRFQAEISRLPFAGEQFDAVIFNASFHYSEDYQASLREALRCVRTGGLIIISDTPWYSQPESGKRMVAERHSTFLKHYGTASASIPSLEYLTDARLHSMEKKLSIHWEVHYPWYGLKWEMRPVIAELRGRREPSQFRIYAARKCA
jgi:SAM-dependent methyltransferase